ncbi:hypothetical protein [Sodalis sp. RH22]|uniref:hypothetical protein n=1 Tax=unclassified Sodalis (in: enterobacteria) TaxID=2636512 RepID=UPI0039B4659B
MQTWLKLASNVFIVIGGASGSGMNKGVGQLSAPGVKGRWRTKMTATQDEREA